MKFLAQSWQKQLKHICTLAMRIERRWRKWRRWRWRSVRGGRGVRKSRAASALHMKSVWHFLFSFRFFGFLAHWQPAALTPPARHPDWVRCGGYILNIVACKDDGARWHYFDIYLHLAAASFSPFCISNDPQLSFVDWLCALFVPLFLPPPIRLSRSLLAVQTWGQGKRNWFSTHTFNTFLHTYIWYI